MGRLRSMVRDMLAQELGDIDMRQGQAQKDMEMEHEPRMTHSVISALLLSVIVFHLILAGSWIRVDSTPPYWDEADYLYQGARQYDALRSGGLSAWYDTWISLERVRPPLVPTLTIPFFAILGISGDAGLLVNLVALSLLLVSTYGLGTAMRGRRTGLLATLIVGSYPVLIGLAHILLVEMVMVALVGATLFALWRSDGFRHVGWSIAAGLLTGLGALTKVFFVVFALGPWLVAALQAARRADDRWAFPRPTQLRSLFVSAFLAATVAASWYLPNLTPMLKRSADAAIGAEAAPYGPTDPLHWSSLLRYLLQFLGAGTSFVGFLALLLGIAGLILRNRRSKQNGDPQRSRDRYPVVFLASSVLVGYMLFTSLRNQDLKHVAGILPALAVLSAYGITELVQRWWPGVAGAALVLMTVQAVLGTFPGQLQNRRVSVPVLGDQLLLFYPAQPWLRDCRYAAPNPAPWPMHDILNYALRVADLETLGHDRAKVGIIPDHHGIECMAFLFQAYRRQVPAEVYAAHPHNLWNLDVLVDKTGDRGWVHRLNVEAVTEKLAQPDSEFQRLPRSFALPDGSEATFYARRSSPLLSAPPSPACERRVEFGHSARLLGFDVSLERASGRAQTITITYYWETLSPTEKDYRVFVHFLNPETHDIVFQDDHPLFPRTYPTSMWQPGRFLAERRTVQVPATFSGPLVTLRLGLYNQDGRLPIARPAQASAANATFVDLASIRVSP